MTRRSRLELLAALRPRYAKASKKAKGHMLDEFCAATKCNRKYAFQLLRHGPHRSSKSKRGRRPCYVREVIATLVEVWPLRAQGVTHTVIGFEAKNRIQAARKLRNPFRSIEFPSAPLLPVQQLCLFHVMRMGLLQPNRRHAHEDAFLVQFVNAMGVGVAHARLQPTDELGQDFPR
jgi:hypothetical protein